MSLNKKWAKLYDRKAACIREMKTITESCRGDRLTKEADHRFQFLKSEVEQLNPQIEAERSRRETELRTFTLSSNIEVGDDDPCGTAERKSPCRGNWLRTHRT